MSWLGYDPWTYVINVGFFFIPLNFTLFCTLFWLYVFHVKHVLLGLAKIHFKFNWIRKKRVVDSTTMLVITDIFAEFRTKKALITLYEYFDVIRFTATIQGQLLSPWAPVLRRDFLFFWLRFPFLLLLLLFFFLAIPLITIFWSVDIRTKIKN